LTDELEPGGEGERVVGEHGSQVGLGDVLGSLDLIRAWLEIDICLYEEDVIDWV